VLYRFCSEIISGQIHSIFPLLLHEKMKLSANSHCVSLLVEASSGPAQNVHDLFNARYDLGLILKEDQAAAHNRKQQNPSAPANYPSFTRCIGFFFVR